MATEPLIILVDEKGARVVRKRIQDIGKGAAGAQKQVSLLKRTLATLGVGLLLRAVVRKIAEFEQALSTVQAVSRATEAEFARLTERARELGATTRFTATQAAEGLVFLSRAGFTAGESLAAVGDTLALAQAGALDLASAADITASTIRGFRLEATEAARVADVLALAANSANTNVFELGNSIKFVAPVAAGLSISLEDTVGALESLADAGLKGTLAGTGLRRVLAELESPGTTAEKIFKTLGIETDNVRVSSVGLVAALEELNKAGLDAGQALEIFGQRGGPAFLVLQNNIPNIKAATEELENAAGEARRVADIMDDNLNGALLRVKSAFEAVVLSFGEVGASAFLQRFLNGLASILRVVARNMETAAFATAAFALILGRDFAKRAINAAIAGIVRLNVALVSNPFTIIAVAITTVIALLIQFRNSLKVSGDGVATLADLAKATFEFLAQAVQGFVLFVQDNFGPLLVFLKSIFPEFELSIAGVLRTTAKILDFLIGRIEITVNTIIALFKGLGPALKEIFFDVFNSLIDRVEKAINAIIVGINRVTGIVGIEGVLAVQLGRLVNTAEGSGAELGDAILEGIKSGVERTEAQEAVEGLLARAEEIGQERVRRQMEQAAEFALGAAPTAGALPEDAQELIRLGPILDDLRQQNDLLRLSSREREIQNEILKIEARLKMELSAADRELVREQLEEIRVTQLVSDAIEEVRGTEIDLIAVQEELTLRLEAGTISAEEFEVALRNLELQAIETDKSFEAGLTRGLSRIKDEITDVAGATEDLLVNAFKSAEDALVSFVTTGKVDFKDFVDSLLEDLTRLILKQALLALFSGGAGGIGVGLLGLGVLGGAGAAAAGGFDFGDLFGLQAGGFAKAGEPQLVGERGPEIFTPTMSGRVSPNVPMEPPQVNLSVVNVMDPDEALAALNTPAGEQVVVNIIRRQRRGVRTILS